MTWCWSSVLLLKSNIKYHFRHHFRLFEMTISASTKQIGHIASYRKSPALWNLVSMPAALRCFSSTFLMDVNGILSQQSATMCIVYRLLIVWFAVRRLFHLEMPGLQCGLWWSHLLHHKAGTAEASTAKASTAASRPCCERRCRAKCNDQCSHQYRGGRVMKRCNL